MAVASVVVDLSDDYHMKVEDLLVSHQKVFQLLHHPTYWVEVGLVKVVGKGRAL